MLSVLFPDIDDVSIVYTFNLTLYDRKVVERYQNQNKSFYNLFKILKSDYEWLGSIINFVD